MKLPEDQLLVKESSLPGSGRGLFTKIFISKGTRIIEYTGKITTWIDADQQNGANSYIYFVTKNHVIDSHSNEKELARFVNDARGLKRVKGITNNCKYVEEGLRVFIEAKKDITAGSELFVDYGKEYWDVVKANSRFDKPTTVSFLENSI